MDRAHRLTSSADKLTEGHSQGQTGDSDPGLFPQLLRTDTERISGSILLRKDGTPARQPQSVGSLGMWDVGSPRRGGKREPPGRDLGGERLEVEGSCAKGGGWADCRGRDPEPLCVSSSVTGS